MKTEELIDALSRNVPRISRYAVMLRVGLGLAFGVHATTAIMSAVLGIRPDLDAATASCSFWMKWTYTLSLGLGAAYAATRFARPTKATIKSLWFLTVPVCALAIVCMSELARTPKDIWLSMWLGHSWKLCPWLVLGLGAPIFLGILWSFRKMAPTRLRVAGALAGLTAGAWAATIYCLHCPESSAVFVLTWYTLGMGLASAAGAVLGPRLLRW